jgi:hypothetical protein
MTQVFDNSTDAGNELAIRRGKVVPEDAVNLAYVKSPELSPAENIVIVDTSRITEENSINLQERCKIYYADSLGVLEDSIGNRVVDDEYPNITDVFSVDEDYNALPASEYKSAHILPFVHVSRHFHLDFAGLTLPSDLFEFREDILKVVDTKGRLYLDSTGKPRYKVRITPALSAPQVEQGQQQAYRVYAYVDTDENDELFLVYNKVEISNSGLYVRQRINYKERLNLRPVFEYVPEESEVVDRSSWQKKIYSTKPITLKEQILGVPYQGVDGFKVYVPKKAVGDPRVFQLFHWRVNCDFITSAVTDQIRFTGTVKAGVVVTNASAQSRAPYSLLNLSRSSFNATKFNIVNPLKPGVTGTDQETAAYWQVNIDTVTEEELKQFDLLLWTPAGPSFDFSDYLGKIDAFTRAGGGTLFIDSTGFTRPDNLGPSVSNGVAPSYAAFRNPGHDPGYTAVNPVAVDNSNPLFDGAAQLGGWNLLDGQNNDELGSLNWMQSMTAVWDNNVGYTQFITNVPSDWSVLVRANGNPVTIQKTTGPGRIIFSTFSHLYSTSFITMNIPAWVHHNDGPTLWNAVPDFYRQTINSPVVEGAYKFLFNVALLAVQGRSLGDTDQLAYSSSWSYSTDWQASWVINADNDTLSQSEKDRYSFALLPEDPTAATPVLTPVWKRKLDDRSCEHLVEEAILANPVLRRRQLGSTRRYHLEVSSDVVHTNSLIQGSDPPYAWTHAYSPPFVVPRELGPNVVREEEAKGEYKAGRYMQVSYPPLRYAGQVQAGYAETTEQLTTQRVTWTARGTAKRTVEERYRDVVSVPVSKDVVLHWRDFPQQWPTGIADGPRRYLTSDFKPREGYNHPVGISSWQEHNYYGGAAGNAHLNWPYMGMSGRLVEGTRYQHGQDVTSGNVVQFVQEILNRSIGAGLAVDGNFGSRMEQAVRNFQTRFGARFVDGIIDAETWSILGYQVIRMGLRSGGRTDYWRFFDYPWAFLPMDHISDGNVNTFYAKRSWFGSSPSAPRAIWDYIQITFDQQYDIKAVTVIPYLEGQTQTMMLRSIRVSGAFPMTNYLGAGAQLNNMPDRVTNHIPHTIALGPYRGDTLTVGIGQDGPAGGAWGVARFMGVQDIHAHTTVSALETRYSEEKVRYIQDEFPITASGSVDVTAFTEATAQATFSYTGPGWITEVIWNDWTGLDVSGHGVIADMNEAGLIRFRLYEVERTYGTNFTYGPQFPGGTYYSMNENRVMSPARETGFVSKSDGIKLLCNADKTPYGFPDMPSNVGPNEYQRHFTKLTMLNQGSDTHVKVGFFDINRKEFIVNAAKQPEMSYIEWVGRGPQNVYIYALNEYEDKISQQIPEDNDAPKLPYRWAMPVYGLCKKAGARITLEALPPKLGITDVWPIAVRDGRFSRVLSVRPRTEGFLTTYLRDYQGTNVRAFYGVPDTGGWSTIYGPPMADVVGEEPIILDDDVLQVRQTPIHLVAEPAQLSTYADPVRPAFTVYQRASLVAPWVALDWDEIRDYNTKTGEIFLTTPIQVEDAALLRVDYTTLRRHYYFKRSGDTLLNLNPYSGSGQQFIGKGIYVYLLPEYVKDAEGAVIAASVTDEPLRFTTSPEIFDPLRPEYDPLAVMLGVIYVSTALDISGLSIMDTRRRGGGIKDGANAQEVARLVTESAAYWDIRHGTGSSYQKAGFIVVRLPAVLKDDLTEPEIVEAVERNITAGVRFKLEDLAGNDWSSV